VSRRVLLSHLVLFALFTAACGGSGPAEPPNVLILVSDAFRGDALSCVDGGARTPNLCALAERGALFENAFSNAPWTLPSAVALLTGRYPGWFKRTDDAAEPSRGGLFYRVPASDLLLAEALAERGYRRLAYVENRVARRGLPFQGFENARLSAERRSALAGEIEAAGLPGGDERYRRPLWLLDLFRGDEGGEGEGRPARFLALHWIDDPHAPYDPPLGLRPEAVPEGLPHPVEWYAGLGHLDRPKRELRRLRRFADDMSEAEIGFLRRLYLLEIESVDRRVGLVLDALERSGLAESTVVVFTADHGEGFGEHGEYLHGVSLHGEMVRVPLIFAGPGVEPGRRVAAPVSLVDVVPTLVDLLGIDGLAEEVGPFAGDSLAPVLGGSGTVPRRAIYVASPDRTSRDSVIHGRYRLLAAVDGDGAPELYDHVADPGERRNLAEELPEVRDELLRALARFRGEEQRIWYARRSAGEADLSAEERETTEKVLRAVGYID
jgi:choline-sulfatase